MRLISSLELQQRDDTELAALFSRVSARLRQTGRDTPAFIESRPVLENISHARAERLQP